MIEPFWQKVRAFMHNPIPRRRRSTIASWWEWRGHTYRLRSSRDGAS